MSLLSDIGGFFGGLFGNDPRKKREDQPQPQPSMMRPVGMTKPTSFGSTTLGLPTLNQPAPLVPGAPQQQNTIAQPLQLGGVATHPAPKPVDNVEAAKKQIQANGSGAPFKPEVIAEANRQMAPKAPEKPWYQKAAEDFYGGVNDAGSLVGTTIGSVLPIGDANIYSAQGRTNVAHKIQDATYNPATGQWFKTGADAVNSVYKHQNAGDVEGLAGDLGVSLLNAGSFLPADQLFNVGKAALNAPARQVVTDVIKGGLTGGTYSAAMGAADSMKNDGSAGDVVKTAVSSFGPGALFGALIPAATGSVGLTRNRALNTAVHEGDDIIEEQLANDIGRATSEELAPMPPEKPIPRDPNSPITTSPTTSKPPAITSPNRPLVPETPIAPIAETMTPPRPVVQAPTAPAAPVPRGVAPSQAPEIAPTVMKAPAPAETQAAAIQKAIDEQAVQPAPQPAEVSAQVVEAPKAAQTRVMAEQATPVSPQSVVSDVAAEAANKAPTEAIAEELGSITRKAVHDGSIKSSDGIDAVVSQVTTAAHAAAEKAGTTIDDIIKKGQAVWEKNPEATPKEALEIVPDFTPEQQKVYKDYAQEIGTLRDRSGHSLKGGDQGPWYGPRQFLNSEGKSAEFDARLVNERKRTGVKTNSEGNGLDYSATPYEHTIRRYANAVDAASQRMVDAVETHPETGEATGIKVPDSAKAKLESTLKDVTDKRDEQSKLLSEGNTDAAKELHREIQKDIRKAFNEFIDEIPGSGAARREAINNVKAMRGTYEQTLTQTLTLSNLVNRVADQGTKVVETLKRPLVRGAEKAVGAKYERMAMDGTNAARLNTTKEARVAAKEFARGTMGREIGDNFKATIANAGAGRNPLLKAVAKADATIRAAGGALVQAGDLSTPNVMEALQIGASRPEAKGLKTVADYKKYYGGYIQTQKFQDDLAKVAEVQNPKIGLAGGEIQKSTGTWSNGISKHVDNFVATQADNIKPGLSKNRVVREVNDYVKGNITGYAGVGSRVAGTFRDALVPNRVFKRAAQEAASGDPVATARATKMAAHAVADSIALYGTAGAATALAASGLIGYTGGQPARGSSESAYNKANNIPANQWFLNVGGKRIYFDPARPAGAAGVAADIAGSVVSGAKDVGGTIANIGGQIFDQAGGSSLPKTVMNAYTGYLDSGASDADKKYARQQTEATLAPATGILNNIANATDSSKRAPKGFIDDVKANLPGLRTQVPEAKDARGNVIPNSKQASAGSSLFSVGKNTDTPQAKAEDPVGAEITRLQKISGDVFPTSSNTNADSGDTQGMAKLLLNNKVYMQADDKGKAEYMKKVLGGTEMKDINANISDEDKNALMTAKLIGSKKNAWLDDNDNAASYYTADYNNAKASGTLTAQDDNLQHKSGKKYLAITAQVNKELGADKELQQLYQDIDSTEFKAMLDPESDDYDPETATKLYHYDEARTKAGVSDKSSNTSKQKYSLKTSGKGAGSRGGKAAHNFAFASMPSSLIGAGGTGSGGGKDYADGAPLYKPIADLQAPAPKEIPKGRTISVKKGINI